MFLHNGVLLFTDISEELVTTLIKAVHVGLPVDMASCPRTL